MDEVRVLHGGRTPSLMLRVGVELGARVGLVGRNPFCSVLL
jgi:hypothetical protein